MRKRAKSSSHINNIKNGHKSRSSNNNNNNGGMSLNYLSKCFSC